MSLSMKNTGRPAPKWFRKMKNALGYLIDGAIVILLALGHGENSLLMLVLRIGYARLISAIEAMLSDEDDDYVSNIDYKLPEPPKS